MLFQTITVLAITATVMAHPRASRHSHHFKASGSGGGIVPTGGMYGMANGTSAYGPTGTGFATGTSTLLTKTGSKSPIDTAVAAAPDVSACDAGSNSTTTIYSTDLVTLTVTAENTVTIQTSSVATTYAASNATATSSDETQSSSAVVSQSMTVPQEFSVDAASAAAAETSSADSYASSASPISSEVISATSASPSEITDPPVTSPKSGYESSTMNAPGAFYEASQSQSAVSSSATPASSAPPTGSYSTGKRGLAYNSAELTNAFAGKSMGWAYNWAASPGGTIADGIEYVPMLWGEKAFSGWDAAAKSALASGSTHMLSFNEPDLSAQANMDSATAAAAHIKYMNPYAGQAKIGSPSITNGGPAGGTDGLGLGWMQNFFDKCAGSCKVDFLTFHWYASATEIAYFKKYVQSVIDMAKENGVSKVWLTEFGASGSDEEVAKFLGEALAWMDSNDAVERYAYFMCGDGQLVSGTSISDPVGKAYAG
jgi:Glycosyl hydrolase catalytic core